MMDNDVPSCRLLPRLLCDCVYARIGPGLLATTTEPPLFNLTQMDKFLGMWRRRNLALLTMPLAKNGCLLISLTGHMCVGNFCPVPGFLGETL